MNYVPLVFHPACSCCVFYIVDTCLSGQRTTVKRTCIKSLPSVLCIHLMRFGFDWESGRSIKYDEQIRVKRGVLYINPTLVGGNVWLLLFIDCIIVQVPLGAEHGAVHRRRDGPSRL